MEKKSLNVQDAMMELIKQMVGPGKTTLDYVSFKDYEVPPRTNFTMLRKPMVSIKQGKMSFNSTCVKLFSGVKYIVPLINRKTHKLAVIPVKEEESCSVEWSRLKDDAWISKDITSREFVRKIYEMMGWENDKRYKILGRLADSDRGLILVFDLDEAVKFESVRTVNPETGKVRKKSVQYFPETYKDRIGRDYGSYMESLENERFEELGSYADQTEEEVKVAVKEVPADSMLPIIKEATDGDQRNLPGVLEEQA